MVLHALDGVRVLELARGVACSYAGRLLLEHGAEVVKLEGGVDAGGVADTEPSRDEPGGGFLLFNAGKRSVAVDLERDRDVVLRLVAGADVLVEDQPPGRLAALGLGDEVLRAANPRLVALSLTPFGSTGPHRSRVTHPLIDTHAGGEGWELVRTVSPEEPRVPLRPPVTTGGDATEAFCGLMAATGVMAALWRRRATGVGNHIDLSKQEASMWPAHVELSAFPNAGVVERRRTRERMPGGVLRTLDGWVEVMPFEDRMWHGLLDAMGRPDWADAPQYEEQAQRLALAAELNPRLEAWTSRRTAREVYETLQAHGCPAYEVMTVEGLARSEHYSARGFFVDVDVPGSGTARIPSTPFTGAKPTYGPPPRLGEHTAEVLAGLDGAGPAPPPTPAAPRSATGATFLEGIRVLDLTFNRAGPSCTAMMAALGAEVIRVESRVRIDPNRLHRMVSGKVVYGAGGEGDGVDLESRWSFGSINMGKKSILLNLQSPAMPPVLRRLVEVSDVVVESFTPGVLERYGVGYDVLSQWRDDVVLVSVNGFGRDGPHGTYRGYADIFGAAGGLQHTTGYPDEPPMPFVGRLDSVVGTYGALGALTALLERAATGRGQHVDVSAAEAVTCMLGTPMVAYLADGRVAARDGNRVPHMAPHNCYRCAGHDDWLALAVGSDEEWRALCGAMGRPELADDPRFADLAGRKADEPALDELVGAWAATRDAAEAADLLQGAGVAATRSMRPDQLFADPHLAARGAWVRFEHPVQGERHDLRLPWVFADGGTRYGPAPLFGQHNAEVYEGLLGMSPAEVADLVHQQVVH